VKKILKFITQVFAKSMIKFSSKINAGRYFIDELSSAIFRKKKTIKNEQQNPIILHNSPSGAVERVIYALLEKFAKQAKDGKRPQFPLWLAPTQVRVIPLKNDFLEFSNDLASKLTKQNIRVDIDDRNDTISKRIRDAEKEWISYVLVIGEKEVKSTSLSVRDRTTGDVRQLSVEDFVKEIHDAISGKPISKLNSPILLSQRPQIMV